MSFRSGFNSDLVLNNLRITGKLTLDNADDTSELDAETLNCSGLATLGALVVTGQSDLDTASINTLAVSGDSLLDNLNVTGLATLSQLIVPGNSELSTVVVSGSATVQALTVSGNTSLDTVDVHGNIVANNLTVTPAQLGYVSGVTSSLQTQLNGKATLASPTFTGVVTVPNILANSQTVTPAQLGYVSGVTSSIQTQLNAKATLASANTFTGLVTASGGVSTTTLHATGTSQFADVSSNNMSVAGNLTVTGQVLSSVPSNMEVISYQLLGNAAQVSYALQLKQNTSNTTNYAVFNSIYYGYTGSSSGTYNAANTAGAIDQIVISNRTTSSFVFNLAKGTSNNVNVWIVFLVVYNASGTSYPVSNS